MDLLDFFHFIKFFYLIKFCLILCLLGIHKNEPRMKSQKETHHVKNMEKWKKKKTNEAVWSINWKISMSFNIMLFLVCSAFSFCFVHSLPFPFSIWTHLTAWLHMYKKENENFFVWSVQQHTHARPQMVLFIRQRIKKIYDCDDDGWMYESIMQSDELSTKRMISVTKFYFPLALCNLGSIIKFARKSNGSIIFIYTGKRTVKGNHNFP